MIVRYWQPWRETETLRRQMDRLLNDLVETGNAQRYEQPSWSPAIELNDAGDAFVLRAQIPGVNAKDIDIQVMKDTVQIAGERHFEQSNQEDGYHKSEFRYGKFSRTVRLPIAVQNDKVEAGYTNGILSLTLPKVVEAQNKVVKVNLTGMNQPSANEQDGQNQTEATVSDQVAQG